MTPAQMKHMAAGLCLHGCGRVLATKTKCRECADKEKVRAARVVSGGLCRQCRGRALFTNNICRECWQKQKTHKANLVSSGLCVRGCGRPRVTKAYCRVCLDKSKARKADLVLTGLCGSGCGRPLVTKNHCLFCKDKKKALVESRASSGVCSRGCGRALFTKKLCRDCSAAATAKKHGLRPEHYRLAREKIPNCQACGVVMTDGNSKTGCCVDHCHATGVRRGFLCRNCNTALGLLYEDPVKIQGLKDYIVAASQDKT